MVVYWDMAALLNFLLDYLLLYGAARLAGLGVRRLRLMGAAALGAAYAVGQLLLPLPPWALAASMALMCRAAFSGTGCALRLTLLFAALACALGGAVVLLGCWTGNLRALAEGLLYARLPWGVFFFAAGLCFVMTRVIFHGGARHAGCDLVRARITFRGRTVTLTLLRDTGNTLTDPATGKRVAVVRREALLPLFTPEEQAQMKRGEAEAALRASGYTPLSYRTVGVAEGALPSFLCESISVNGREYGARRIAVTDCRFDGAGYQGLWHSEVEEYGHQEMAGEMETGTLAAWAAARRAGAVHRGQRYTAPAADAGAGGGAAGAAGRGGGIGTADAH